MVQEIALVVAAATATSHSSLSIVQRYPIIENAYNLIDNNRFSWKKKFKALSFTYMHSCQEDFKKILLVFTTYAQSMAEREKLKNEKKQINYELNEMEWNTVNDAEKTKNLTQRSRKIETKLQQLPPPRLITTAISLNCKFLLEFLKLKGKSFKTDPTKGTYLADCIEAMHLASLIQEQYDNSIFDYLLDNDASLSSPECFTCEQPLYLALKYGFESIARKLITKGADPDKKYIAHMGLKNNGDHHYFQMSVKNFIAFRCLTKSIEMENARTILAKICAS